MIPAVLLLITSFFLFKIKYLHYLFSQGFTNLFYAIFTSITLCLFSMLLNDDIVDIENADRICWLTFNVEKLSRLFLHSSIFSIIHSQSV